jgi:hypothetical protein
VPATSVAQQRLFGMVLAAKRGQLKNPSAKVSQVASHISESSARDFAKTKDKGLPQHVKPKKRKIAKAAKPVAIPRREFVEEHEHLDKVLATKTRADDRKERKKQAHELDVVLGKGMSQPCPFCKGEGRYGAYDCEACHGTGRRQMAQKVEVRKAMQVVQLPGMVVLKAGLYGAPSAGSELPKNFMINALRRGVAESEHREAREMKTGKLTYPKDTTIEKPLDMSPAGQHADFEREEKILGTGQKVKMTPEVRRQMALAAAIKTKWGGVKKSMRVVQLPGMVVIQPETTAKGGDTMGYNFKPEMKPSWMQSELGGSGGFKPKKPTGKGRGPVHDEDGDQGFNFKPGQKPSYLGNKGPSYSGGFPGQVKKAMERLAELRKSADQMDPDVLKQELLQLNAVINQMRASQQAG